MSKSIQGMNVHERIIGVMSEMTNVRKDGTVAFGKTNYQYVSEAAFIAALRPLLLRYRLTIFPVRTEISPTDKGMTRLLVTYRLTAADYIEGDEYSYERYIDINTSGEGADASDKGVYKAMTGAFKYALRQSFMISTGDDAEATDVQGNKTATKTPFEALRAELTKFNIKLDETLRVPLQEAFTALPKLQFVSQSLTSALSINAIDINSSDHDRLNYAQAIRAYIKSIKNATTSEDAQAAYDTLLAGLE